MPELDAQLLALVNSDIHELIASCLSVMFKINQKLPDQNILMTCKLALSLSRILELSQDFKEAETLIQSTIKLVSRSLQKRQSRKIEGKEEPLLPTTLTCSQSDIKATVSKMKASFQEIIEKRNPQLKKVSQFFS